MLTLARVIDVHPESHAVDLEMLQDGRRLSGVQVLAASAGGNFGVSGLTGPDKDDEHRQLVMAAVGFLDKVPVVVGFLYPQVSQMLFQDKHRMVGRHQSDVYVTVDKDGNTEVVHPSGAYVVISKSPGPSALGGKDYDKIWKQKRNTKDKPFIALSIPGEADVLLSPSGSVSISARESVSINAGKHIGLSAPRIDLN